MLRRPLTLALVTCALALSACGEGQAPSTDTATSDGSAVEQTVAVEITNPHVDQFVADYGVNSESPISSVVDQGSHEGLHAYEGMTHDLTITVSASETEAPYLEVRIPVAGTDPSAVEATITDCMAVLDAEATDAALDAFAASEQAAATSPVKVGSVQLSASYAEDGTIEGITLAKTS